MSLREAQFSDRLGSSGLPGDIPAHRRSGVKWLDENQGSQSEFVMFFKWLIDLHSPVQEGLCNELPASQLAWSVPSHSDLSSAPTTFFRFNRGSNSPSLPNRIGAALIC